MDEPRWLNDTQQHAWRALRVLMNRGLPQLQRTFRDNDMLMIEFGILVALSEAPNSEMRLSDLANFSNSSQSRLTHRMKRLMARGDIATRESSDDRRVTYAEITATGRRRLESVAPQHAEDVQQLIFDHLDPDQTSAFADALATIAATLCDHDHFQGTCETSRSQAR